MLKSLVLATAVAVTVPISVPQPAVAYDPCVRATRDYREALRTYENYCHLIDAEYNPGYACAGGRHGPRAERLYAEFVYARQRMRNACY